MTRGIRALAAFCVCVPFACVTFGSGKDLAIPRDPKRGVQSTTRDPVKFPEGSYTGPLRDGYPHGQGRFEYIDGSVYEGAFEMGKRHGAGRTTYSNGRVVTASYERDADPTSGKIQYPQGPVYEGSIKASAPSGDGTLTRPDGVSIMGPFNGDTVNGFGVYSAPNRDPFWGPLANGVPNGQGVCGEALCNMRNGKDETKSFIEDLAKKRTDQALTRDTDAALEKLEKRHKEETDKTSSALVGTQRINQRLYGPDDECACHLGKPCIGLASSEWDERTRACNKMLDHREADACRAKVYEEKKQAEIERKREREEEKRRCREQYAKWLSLKDDPAALAREREEGRAFERLLARELVDAREAYKKARTELEERRRQQLADEEERKRVRAKIDADIKAERERELDRLKKRCSGRTPSAADCVCGAVFKLPPSKSKHAVCKA